MNLDGLWTVQFLASTGMSGGGVVVLADGKVRGGDSSYFYIGRYKIDGVQFQCDLNINHFYGSLSGIFGPVRTFSLRLEGSTNDQLIIGRGFDPSAPSRQVNVRLQRVAE